MVIATTTIKNTPNGCTLQGILMRMDCAYRSPIASWPTGITGRKHRFDSCIAAPGTVVVR
ncbi:MAG: hypothetical protein Q8Q08_08840 [Candidatus Omnitrophota bacterium]|nr:hypothetical protein [Candidatus Omnitrophota bacterium]